MKRTLRLPLIFTALISQCINAQWVQQSTSTGAALPSIHCIDDNNCFAVGGAGTGVVRKTVDGATWTISNPSTLTSMISVKMLDVNKIWSGKSNGTFHRTTNAGGAWSQVVPATTSHVIYDIFFHDANNHLAVGGSPSNTSSGGNVSITTTNGGTSWTAQNNSGVPTMFGVHCINTSTCVACAGAETIFKSTDGGQTWTSKHSGTTNVLYDIDFPSSSIGYAVGGDPSGNTSIALKTTDGGDTWTALPLNTSNVMYSVHFTSTTTGHVVGKGGAIYKTTDGGATWGSQVSPVATDLNRVFFPSANIGYISGAGGVILKTTDGGGTVTAISETNKENGFILLNNPSNVEITIQTNFMLRDAQLVILNSIGQEAEVKNKISGNSVPVNTSALPSGIYFFRLNDGRENISGKFLVN